MSSRSSRIGIVLAAATAWTVPAYAQGTVNVAPSATNPVGAYSGAKPGEGAPPGVKARRGKFPLVTWVGFQPQDGGGARVFVQLDRETTYQQEVSGGVLHVVIDNARHANRNARRQLDTRFFQTGIERISTEASRRRKGAKRRSSGVELTIRFKNPADVHEASASMSGGKDGMSYLILEFGAPSGGVAPPPKAAPAVDDEPE
jgi:hypothetical protein